MKRYIIGIIVLVSIVSIISLNVLYINKTSNHMEEHLKKIQTLVVEDKWEEANTELTAFSKHWEKNKEYLCTMINHQDIDAITIPVKKVKQHLEFKNKEFFLVECSILFNLIENFKKTEKISLVNIL